MPSELRYRVSLTSAKGEGAEEIDELYHGDDHSAAIRLASLARSRTELRGRWIKFVTPSATKWAEIS